MLSEHTNKKDDKWSAGSRKKLMANISYRIRRVFASYLDMLEFQLRLKETDPQLFERLRYKILTLGNDQIRNMELELERYNIEYIPYSYELKMISTEELFKKVFKEHNKKE